MDSLTQAPVAPTLPREIIHMIISYLGKYDLLKCRTVSKEWDSECRRILWKSSAKLKLNPTNIGKYADFLEGCEFQPPPLIPIKISVYLGVDLESFVEALRRVVEMLGDEAVPYLKLKGGSEFEAQPLPSDPEQCQRLLEILDLISSGLINLNMWRFTFDLEAAVAANLTAGRELSLPKLGRFLSHTDEPRDESAIPVLFKYIVSASPNLKDLSMTLPPRTEINLWEIPLQILKTLRLTSFIPTPNFLLEIQNRRPIIKKLEMNACRFARSDERNALTEILKNLSPTLEKIKFDSRQLPIYKFPTLTQLKKLKWTNTIYLPVFPNAGAVNFGPDTFPNLEKLQISLLLEEGQQRPPFTNSGLPLFPKMKRFRVKSHVTGWEWEWTLQDFLQNGNQ